MKGSKVLFSSKSDNWSTPKDFYRELDSVYHFTLDPCTTRDNPLGTRYFYTKEDDGLSKDWSGHSVFCNPPYTKNQATAWLKKGYETTRSDVTQEGTTVVYLLPARTSNKWFAEYAIKAQYIGFVKGRLKFGGMDSSAPFPSMIVTMFGAYSRYVLPFDMPPIVNIIDPKKFIVALQRTTGLV